MYTQMMKNVYMKNTYTPKEFEIFVNRWNGWNKAMFQKL
jgi:hypothetical protein